MSYHVWATVIFLSLSASLVGQSVSREDATNSTSMLSASGKAFQALQSRSDGTWKVSKNRDTGLPRMLMGAKSASYGTNAVDAAQHFLQENSDLFLPGNAGKPQDKCVMLRVSSTKSLPGSTVVGFDEEYKGISVYGASVIVMVDSSGRVVHVTSTANPRAILPTTPAKTFQEVDSILRSAQTNQAVRLTAATNTLVILPGDTPRLAYQAFYKVGNSDEPWAYLLDAATGQTLKATRLVQEDAIGPPAKPAVEGLQNQATHRDQASSADKLLTTCKVFVDLTAGNEARAAQSSGTSAFGTTTYAVSGITDLVGGEDEDGDGYYDTYHLQIRIDVYASPGPATVYGRLICESTGQQWQTAKPWAINGTTCDSQYLNFDETAFLGEVYGNSSLDFTVELWKSADAGSLPEEAAINAQPRWTSSSAASSRTRNTGRLPKQTAIHAETAKTSALVDSARTLVFDPNPVNTLNNTNLTDQNNADAPIFSNAYIEVDLTHLTVPSTGALYQLMGDFVRMEDIEPLANTPPSSSNLVFVYRRNDPAFEEVMCYYHITRNQEYIQSLGFTNINNRQHSVDAHSYARVGAVYKGAYYKAFPQGFGYLAFGDDGASGTGGVDVAEDTDAILHEYGHSIQDNSTPGRYFGQNDRGHGDETGAMGEGFGDYWACSCTYAQSVEDGYNPAYVGEWVSPPYLRRVDTSKHYPEDMSHTDIYQSCEIWSASLWDIFMAIGKDAADRIILASHFLVPTNPSFEDGAYALLAADDALYSGTDVSVITSIFVTRGILNTPPPGTLQLSSSTYSVNEKGGTVTITATRTGGSFGAVSMNCATADGTATASLDYTAQNSVLVWTNGDTEPKTFTVNILDDAIVEGNETFDVQIGAVSGAHLGSPATATVTILDDDGGGIIGGEVWSPSSSTSSSTTPSSRNSRSGRERTAEARSSRGRNAPRGAHVNSGGTTALSGDGSAMVREDQPSSSASVTPPPADSLSTRGEGSPTVDGVGQNALATTWTPVQVSLFPPFQMLSSDSDVIGVRVNVLMGYNARVTGLDVGTVANQVGNMCGLQVAIGNQAMYLGGIQVGLANQIGYLGPPAVEAHGQAVQPIAQAPDTGLQIGLLNSVGRMSPLSPDDTPKSFFSGIQIGIVNFADDVAGVQVGALANEANEVTGLQVSLLWNQARILRGVQIGLVNSTGNGLLRDSLGGVPIINAAF